MGSLIDFIDTYSLNENVQKFILYLITDDKYMKDNGIRAYYFWILSLVKNLDIYDIDVLEEFETSKKILKRLTEMKIDVELSRDGNILIFKNAPIFFSFMITSNENGDKEKNKDLLNFIINLRPEIFEILFNVEGEGKFGTDKTITITGDINMIHLIIILFERNILENPIDTYNVIFPPELSFPNITNLFTFIKFLYDERLASIINLWQDSIFTKENINDLLYFNFDIKERVLSCLNDQQLYEVLDNYNTKNIDHLHTLFTSYLYRFPDFSEYQEYVDRMCFYSFMKVE